VSTVDRDITIREAVADDVPMLVEFLIRLDAHVAGVSPDELELTAAGAEQLRLRIASFLDTPGKRLSVAETGDGALAGMGDIHIWHYADIWVNPERRGRRSAFIDDLWVEPDWRGRGIAHRIVEDLLAFADTAGIDELLLEYALHNPEAAAYWERLGFRPTGVRAAARLPEVMARLAPPKEAAPRATRKKKKPK
jgi:ribosomal protein S18 acetylase RimI-like enzyme